MNMMKMTVMMMEIGPCVVYSKDGFDVNDTSSDSSDVDNGDVDNGDNDESLDDGNSGKRLHDLC
jgi:hypothetical protein